MCIFNYVILLYQLNESMKERESEKKRGESLNKEKSNTVQRAKERKGYFPFILLSPFFQHHQSVKNSIYAER